ncbi:MAG TPA: PEGA domain-containing protein [Kofleriaceae bacterium]|jgi:tetratricopeptide (TPR) repeat protein|nr:PEGA domain-containing protein [Kofleriaceae bacterium]
MKSRVVFAVGMVICALAAIRPALAQPADALKKAQAAFDKAQLDYLQGKYDDAAQGFIDAFAARPFPQFLYNAGASYHMKGKKASDPDAYQKAVDAYRSYLDKDPQAADKAKVEKAIGVLEAEIKRLKDPAGAGTGSAATGTGTGSAATTPTGTAPAPAAPSQEVEQLGDAKPRGLIVIESDPSNATVYLDDKRKGPFATTPWSGSLDGDHKIIIEKRGYTVVERPVSADPTKLFVLSAAMSQQSFLGWVEITSNVPGADIFIDDKTVGSVGRTPLSQNIKPGKHTFWISADGYDEYRQEIDVIPNETHTIKAQLKGSPVGKLNITGLGIEDATIVVDGKPFCERGPCLKSLQQGEHTITVTRPDFKPYTKRITIQAKTETQVRVTLVPTPSRSDAIVAYVLAGAFGAGGVVLGLQANKYRDDLKKEIGAGNPPPDSNDPRFTRGKIFAIAADAAYAVAGITALTAVYYTFREKGAPSTGLIDVRALALRPEIGPSYAGLAMGVSW